MKCTEITFADNVNLVCLLTRCMSLSGVWCTFLVCYNAFIIVACLCSQVCPQVLAVLSFRDQESCRLPQHLRRRMLEYRIGLLEYLHHQWCEFSRRYHQPLRHQVLQSCKQPRQVCRRSRVFMYLAVSVLWNNQTVLVMMNAYSMCCQSAHNFTRLIAVTNLVKWSALWWEILKY